MILVCSCCRRGFSISSNLQELILSMRRLWSVATVKWLRPARKRWHFLMAQATAKHSSSITAYMYLLSVSARNCDSACTTRQSELFSDGFWRRRKTNPRVLASVIRQISLEPSRTGADMSDCLACINALSWVVFQRKSLRVLRSGRSGARRGLY